MHKQRRLGGNGYYTVNVGKPDPVVRLQGKGGIAPKKELPAYLQKAYAEEQRMAGDALSQAADDIIGELRDEAAYEDIQGLKDMVAALHERDDRVNSRWDEARHLAKLTPEQTGDVQLVGNITPGVPEAVVVEYDRGTFGGKPVRNETRLHTKFELNPLTGQMDVVPFVAKGESKPLITEFGLVDDQLARSATEGMHSDEFLGKRILQLMGRNPVENNNRRVTAVDLKDQDTGKGVDVEILKTGDLRRGNGVGMQVYTQIAPSSQVPTDVRTKAESQDAARKMVRELEPLVKNKMAAENLTVEEAVNALAQEGLVSNAYGNDAPYGGKLLKEGGQYADKVVYPVMTNDEAFQNLRTSNYGNQPRGLVQPLSGAFLVDVPTVQERVKTNRGRKAAQELSFRPLPGNDGRTPAGKIYVQLPTDAQGVYDLGDRAAAVRQLFRKQKK